MLVTQPSTSLISERDIAVLATEIRTFYIKHHEAPFEIKFLESGVTYDACGIFLGAYFDGQFFGTKQAWERFCLEVEEAIEAKEKEEERIQLQNAKSAENIRQHEMEAYEKPNSIKPEPAKNRLLEALDEQSVILEVNLTHPESAAVLAHYYTWRQDMLGCENIQNHTQEGTLNFGGIAELMLFASFLAEKSINVVLLNHPGQFIAAHNGKIYQEKEVFVTASSQQTNALDAMLNNGLFKMPSPLSMAPRPTARKDNSRLNPFSTELRRD